MSVINQMLRDLDQRSASPLEPKLAAGTSARKEIREPVLPRSSLRAGIFLGGTVLALCLAGAAWWYSKASPVAPDPLPAASTATEAPKTEATVLPAQGASLRIDRELSERPGPLREASAPVVKPIATDVAGAGAPLAAAPVAVRATASAAATPPVQVAPQPASLPAPPSLKIVPPVADAAVLAQRQQVAVRDLLSQAQSMYSGGSADAAIQLLQETLAGLEKAQPPTPPATQLQLVRELARMELAQGQSAAVLDLLGRLEPLLAGQADLWAVRANAAQRLGRHQDAVQFYGTALQTRPAEQRWLLGSAVSLAALGQLGAAAELADKARAIGPVSKEVLAYLRQQGVTLPERP
ncbi:hypothetical protein [Rhodoferax sp.]|uniref:hypothetical protein n=1 Tax=Rhodoferax sp. TaxID=50421 RepID=UPI0025F5DB40|nr:hypothetical protein [Rhodoferax sp.]